MMKNKGILVLMLLGIALLVCTMHSCGGKGYKRIPPNEVRRLLPGLTLLSASLQNQSVPDTLRVDAYRKFLADEGYTLADWDSSMAWYAKNNMPLYYDFYRTSSDSLNKEGDRLQRKQDSVFKVEELIRKRYNYALDSVNLLSIGASSYKGGELINQSFSIVPQPAYTGCELTLSTRVVALPRPDKSKGNSPLTLYLQLSQSDSSVVHKSLPISQSGHYTLSLRTRAGISVLRVQGYLRGITPKLSSGKYVFIDSLRLERRPAIDSVEVSSKLDSVPPPTIEDTADIIQL